MKDSLIRQFADIMRGLLEIISVFSKNSIWMPIYLIKE